MNRIAGFLAVLATSCLIDNGSWTTARHFAGSRLSAQTKRIATAISGVIRDGGTGTPISGAIVLLGSRQSSSKTASKSAIATDSKGRFVFEELVAGEYTITALKSGYVEATFGGADSDRKNAATIIVLEGQWFAEANISLSRNGGISGNVLDEQNEPQIGVYVRLLQQFQLAGRSHLAAGPLTTTNDLGMYRFGGLVPGHYVVMVPAARVSLPGEPVGVDRSRAAGAGTEIVDIGLAARQLLGHYPIPPPPGVTQTLTYPTTFAGGAAFPASDAVISIEPGRELAGIDVRLKPVPAFEISGRLAGPLEARAGLTVRLLSAGIEELGSGTEAGIAVVGVDGSFHFSGVPSGSYIAETSGAVNRFAFGSSLDSVVYGPRPPSIPGVSASVIGSSTALSGGPAGTLFGATSSLSVRYWGRAELRVVERDIKDLILQLRPTTNVSGRVVEDLDKRLPMPTVPARFVVLETTTGDVRLGVHRSVDNVTLPGEFLISGLIPGPYVVRSESAGWLIKSAILDGRNLANSQLEVQEGRDVSGLIVTFTNSTCAVTGDVADKRGLPPPLAAVIVFPVERDQRTGYGLSPSRIKWARTSTNGSFRVENLPAGDYFALAVSESQIDDWKEPGFFERAEVVATRVFLDWGARKVLHLDLAGLR
jgi:carboxypeptidase family protein